jgi:hypothetical protein
MSTGCTPGALYIAGFTQVRASHIGLLLATTETEGTLFHIRIDRSVQPNWHFQRRKQRLVGDMFLSSLMRISKEPLSIEDAKEVLISAESVPAPENDEFGECAPWVYRVIDKLNDTTVLKVVDIKRLEEEVASFAQGSSAFARRDKFPNLAVSEFCQ